MRLLRLVKQTAPPRALQVILVAAVIVFPASISTRAFAEMSLQQAARIAVTTNPDVARAAANRRAVDSELRQAYGAYLPKLDIAGDTGRQKIDRPRGLTPANNNKWRSARQVTATASWVLFNGFERINSTYRQKARVQGAALRVLERSELIALRATEVFLDVLRLRQQQQLARTNLAAHRDILSIVNKRRSGGAATEGEVLQVEERVRLADATLARIRQELGEAGARFRSVIGKPAGPLLSPGTPGLRAQGLSALMSSAEENNTTLQASEADIDAAHRLYKGAKAPFLPEVSLEGFQQWGQDLDATPGRNDEQAVKLKLSWNIFNGGIDRARREELAERWGEAQIELDANRRDIMEIVESSWATYSRALDRLSALRGRSKTSRELVVAYRKEYELGRRSLLNLLDAQNSLFNSEIEHSSVANIRIFAGYRILAATGQILLAMNIAAPVEASTGPAGRFGRQKYR